jgi:hypothetical protein
MDNPNHSTHAWVGGFAGRLMQLRPHVGIGSAVNYAVLSIHHAADLDPHRAAEIFLLANPMTEASKPRRATRPVEPPSAKYRALFGLRAA